MKYHIGTIIKPPTAAIAHQCNAVSYGRGVAKGVAKSIFKAFPYGDLYAKRSRSDREIPSTTLGAVHLGLSDDPSLLKPHIFNLIAQKNSGRPRDFGDSHDDRIQWMKNALGCLSNICEVMEIPDISFPYGCGCGLAGGNWVHYLRMIRNFEKESGVTVVIVVLEKFKHLIEFDAKIQ